MASVERLGEIRALIIKRFPKDTIDQLVSTIGKNSRLSNPCLPPILCISVLADDQSHRAHLELEKGVPLLRPVLFDLAESALLAGITDPLVIVVNRFRFYTLGVERDQLLVIGRRESLVRNKINGDYLPLVYDGKRVQDKMKQERFRPGNDQYDFLRNPHFEVTLGTSSITFQTPDCKLGKYSTTVVLAAHLISEVDRQIASIPVPKWLR